MRLAVRPGVLCLAMLWPAVATTVHAQCPDQAFDAFEAQGYKVRAVRVSGPLVDGSSLRDHVVAPSVRAGAPVTAAAIESGKQALRSTLRDLPSLFDSPVAATLITADVDACDPAAKELDVVYKIFTTKLALGLSRTFEGQRLEAEDPAARLAMGKTALRYRIAPLLRYDALEHLVGGAHASLALPRLFDRLDADVEASQSIANADLDLSGARSADARLIRTLEWRAGVHRHERPTGEHELKDQNVAAQVSAVTRPLGSVGSVLRFASSLQGGTQRIDVNTGYGSWKNAVGVTLRSRHHALSGSYGLQLGFTRGSGIVDYTKSLGDVAYDGHFLRASGWLSHRSVDVTSRFGLGRLTGVASAPASERFFGGNIAVPFLAGEAWDFRSNPVLRSFPALSFSDVGNEARTGGDYFFSYNVTASIPAWFRPLVPRDIASDSFVRQALDGQLESAETTLQTSYKIADPAHQRAVEASRPLENILASLRTRLSELTPTIPEPLKPAAESCDDQADTLIAIVGNITSKTYVGSLLAEPVDEGDATLPSVLHVCIERLNAGLSDGTLSRIGEQLSATRAAMANDIAQIDVTNAQRLAARDMAFARGAVTTILDEMNAISVGPIVAFDAARLGQHTPPASELTRYGLGTGIRVSVASSFHLSAGYMWNLNRSATERRGAAFFVAELSTLFGK